MPDTLILMVTVYHGDKFISIDVGHCQMNNYNHVVELIIDCGLYNLSPFGKKLPKDISLKILYFKKFLARYMVVLSGIDISQMVWYLLVALRYD